MTSDENIMFSVLGMSLTVVHLLNLSNKDISLELLENNGFRPYV